MKKSILIVTFIIMAFLLSNTLNQSQVMGDHLNPIVPDIKANGADGPLIINSNDTLSITIELTSGGGTGNNADWWLVAATPFGLFHYRPVDGSWGPDLTYSHQGPLFNLGEFEVLNISGLPAGSYKIYFGVDMDMNSTLNMDQAYYDSVTVYINGGDDLMDTDGDRIPDVLETNGYTYDFDSLSFKPWNGDISQPYFKSDPTQKSTDQDAWSDYDESSTVNMDTSVLPPGNHPMVPAYPNFSVKLIDYTITLIADITTMNGETHSSGDSFSVQTEDTTSFTEESNWGSTSGVGAGLKDIGASVSLSFGGSESKTHTTGTVISQGWDRMDSTQWSLSTCANPSKAASIKFTLLVKNVGTFPAHNAELTLNLKLGGKSIKTITTNEIETLSKDADPFTLTVPEQGNDEIILTYDELRSLETGVPVSIEVSQITADIQREIDGIWEPIDTVSQFMSRIRPVCANIFLDLGDGNTIDQLVYAAASSKAPAVTLRDAIIWVAGGEDTVQGPVITFYTAAGHLEEKSLDGWYFSLDETTYKRIEEDIQNPNFNLFDTVLGPQSIVVAKAPPVEDWPKIRWVTLSPCDEKVTAYVDDYFFDQSKLTVIFVDKDGINHSMTWDKFNAYFEVDIPNNYVRGGNEKITAKTPMNKEAIMGQEWYTEIDASQMGYFPCRFKDMKDGTVLDISTNLVWLKDANSFDKMKWEEAKSTAGRLCDGTAGLTDRSNLGDWRLPTKAEWEAFMSPDYNCPALVNGRGNAKWSEGDLFNGITTGTHPRELFGWLFWSSDTVSDESYIWTADTSNGEMREMKYAPETIIYRLRVWPVRDFIPTETLVTIYHDKTEWEAAVAELGGHVLTFETKPENLGLAEEPFKDGPKPPVEGTQSHMGPILTFVKSKTYYPFSFNLQSPNAKTYGLTYWDIESSGPAFGLSEEELMRSISIGDVGNEKNDDFMIHIIPDSDHPIVLAIGTKLCGNGLNTANELFAVLCVNNIYKKFPAPTNAECGFVGFVSTVPIDFIWFDEDKDSDEIYIRDLFFGVSD